MLVKTVILNIDLCSAFKTYNCIDYRNITKKLCAKNVLSCREI